MRLCLGVIDRISWDDCYVLVLRSWSNYGIYGVCVMSHRVVGRFGYYDDFVVDRC